MDRVIALLAALVGLIALAGAVLVGTNGDLSRRQLATDIAQLKTGLALATQQQAGSASPASGENDTAATLSSLMARVSELEAKVSSQAVALASLPPPAAVNPSAPLVAATSDENSVLPLVPSALPSQGDNPAALSADGPTADCIPLGTRFMAKAGDAFPICKTKVIVKVASVDDGSATLSGTGGPILAGGAGALPVAGCQAMVLSADLSGYAELRVTCQ